MTRRPRLDVLVYTGTGTSTEAVRHALFSLRRLLSPNYAVIPVGEAALLREPWSATCALLVVPGGADLGYCRVLDGPGNRRIADYVRRGGAYLGLCAGAYFASARCEFEMGRPPYEVVGSRELGFFPGTCRGAAFAGFEYRSERGARAADVGVADAAADDGDDVGGGDEEQDNGSLPKRFTCYVNGGGVFVGAAAMKDRGVEVLARYRDKLDLETGQQDGDDKGNNNNNVDDEKREKESVAVVLCRVGNGKALLSGPHPEFAAALLRPQPDVPNYDRLVAQLAADDTPRVRFLAACLAKLGLEVGALEAPTPPLTRLHLTAIDGARVSDLLRAWDSIADERADGARCIHAEADSFRIRRRTEDRLDKRRSSGRGSLDLDALLSSLPGVDSKGGEGIANTIVAHEHALPSVDVTPRFDHELYYASLAQFRAVEPQAVCWGSPLLYGEVVMSTNSILDRNPKLTSTLPTGFAFTASTQLAGRGRGTNAWVAPPGALAFSIIINHPAELAATRPIVFLQYVAAVAVVEAIQSLGPGYESLPVKLKWPNDIYALDPDPSARAGSYIKIGGLLSQCSYCDGSYKVILGIGLNATNARPTTSLSNLLPASVPPPRLEVLLARILTRFEAVHAHFVRHGFSPDLERRYYRHWLHSGQDVRLEAEGGVTARVMGVTSDWGMLRVEETDAMGKGTGRLWTLQSDENSFDFWKGLVRRKE